MAHTLAPRLATEAGARQPAAPHYDVVALRVEFEPDTTRFTTGDGTFDGPLFGDTLLPKVDPLPHDAAYFDAHLDFLEDYVRRVSDGRTTVTTHLVPGVVRLPRPMGAYSPTGFEADSDEELRKLAALVVEAWTLAESQRTYDLGPLDPAHTAFVLFHAGVGRDIELLGTTLDKTPQDLPSLFLDRAALDRLAGPVALSFNGVPVTHSMILPRTETRRGFDFIQDVPFLLELSTNGLLAASFFNYLGVPDLFDTASGESAIGPFGLMDPLGIFAYRGLFPPEPTGWTKQYLGWTEPQELRGAGPETVRLRAASLPGASDLARADISGAEYFLVENRHRDPEGDGLVLRVWKDGRLEEQRVENGDSTFNDLDIEGFIGGVVVGVDNYDWALPGGVDEDGNELNGGILIWHVDERRLVAGLADNSVNADPQRRALDLEEADGGQDIGFPSGNPLGPELHLGSPFDFFYEGNPVSVINQVGQTLRLYENRFGPGTYPNSDASEGGPSFITLEAFSAPAAEMTFVYHRTSEDGIAPREAYVDGLAPGHYGAGSSLGLVGHDNPDFLLLAHGVPADEAGARALYEIQEQTARPAGPEPGWFGIASKPATHSDGYVAVVTPVSGEGAPYLLRRAYPGAGGRIDLPDEVAGMAPVSPPVVWQTAGGGVVGIAFAEGDSGYLVRVAGEEATAEAVPGLRALAGAGAGGFALVTTSGIHISDGSAAWPLALDAAAVVGQPAFGLDAGPRLGVVPVVSSGELIFVLGDGRVERIDVAGYYAQLQGRALPAGALSPYPVLVDLDADGYLDVLATAGELLLGFTQGGALVEGFPIRLPAPSVAQPLVARLTDSGGWSILVGATDGYVYAYDVGAGGEPVPGFPLAVGHRVAATPLLYFLPGEARLYAVAEDGALRSWMFDGRKEIWWGQLYGQAENTSYVELHTETPLPTGGDLLAASETYNWPNPIREGFTYFTYKTDADARLDVLIVDAAGGRVDAFTVENVRGGVPGEYLWRTDAGSGLYFARITAIAADGRRQTRTVKMAIIR